jgi:flagellar assembly protein FliH
MSSTNRAPRQVPPPAGGRTTAPYARFIPREELQEFAAWNPGSLSGQGGQGGAAPQRPGAKPAAAEPAAPSAADIDAALQAARQSGYEDGYRDGLAALESFKRSFAMQVSAQSKAFVEALAGQFDELDREMAEAVTQMALKLARQVVRSEIRTRPELVAQVASEAVQTLVLAAKHIRVRVHPEDHALVAAGAEDALEMRGAQLMSDPSILRGGCIVESDLGVVDARVANRWAQAAAVFGREAPWEAE